MRPLRKLLVALPIAAPVATIIGAAIAVHLYTATPQGKWLSAVAEYLPGPSTLKLILILVLLTLPWLAIWRSRGLERRVADMERRLEALGEFMTGEGGLTRANVRLSIHEALLDKLTDSLLDRLAADFAPDRRRFAFEQIDGLSAVDRYALFQRHPEVVNWYANIESAAIIESATIRPDDRSEVIFREPDGRAWTFGEIDSMNAGEQEALQEAKPRVWRAYRGRLFRDVVFP